MKCKHNWQLIQESIETNWHYDHSKPLKNRDGRLIIKICGTSPKDFACFICHCGKTKKVKIKRM